MRLIHVVALLLVVPFVIPVAAAALDYTATGAGGGGWLHSGAFLPSNSAYVVIGADISGVYRTTNFGSSWTPWNKGLQNIHENYSWHVEDLEGVEYDGRCGFYAATRGGIYYREYNSGTWQAMTPVPDYACKDSLAWHAEAIPFSCLDWDGDSQIVAGAGRFWWGTDTDTQCYPGLPDWRFTPWLESYYNEQYSVWTLDLNGSPLTWVPDDSSHFGTARDISVAVVDSVTYVAVGTPNGIYLRDQDGWTSVGDSLYDDGDLTCWSLHLTQRGSLYVAMAQTSSTSSLTGGVYRLYDVTATTTWQAVGDTTQIQPTYETIAEIGDKANLVYLSVVDGTGDDGDLLYLGSRDYYLLFRGYQHPSPDSTCEWKHKIWYNNASGFWYTDDEDDPYALDVGWITGDPGIIFHPVVSAFHPDRVAVQISARMHVSDCRGDAWDQCYSDSSGGFWDSRGYNEMAAKQVAFMGDGRALESNGDLGLLRSDDKNVDAWEWLEAPGGGVATPTNGYAYNRETGNMEVREDWMGLGGNAIFVVSGDASYTPNKLFMIDSLDAWHNVTGGLNSDRYLFYGLAFSDDSTCFMGYRKHNAKVSHTSSVVEFGVLRGTYSSGSGQWSWAAWNNGLLAVTTPDSMNAVCEAILYHAASGRVLMAARVFALSGVDIPGGLYVLDSSADSTWSLTYGGSGTLWDDWRCFAQSGGGAVYAGTRGRQTYLGSGGVLKWAYPDSAITAWISIATDTTNSPFGFEIPFWADNPGKNWSSTYANEKLTDVRALAVDPCNANTVFAGLWGEGLNKKAGLWKYASGTWTHVSNNQVFYGMSVTALGFNPDKQGRLMVGSHGQELYFADAACPQSGQEENSKPWTDLAPGLRLMSLRATQGGSRAEIDFSLDRAAEVSLEIYDVTGRLVTRRDAGLCQAGKSSLVWDGRSGHGQRCASGVYFVRLRAEREKVEGKLVLVK